MLGDVVLGLGYGAAYSVIAVAVVLIYSCTRSLSIAMGEIGAFAFFTTSRWRERGMPVVDWKPSPLVAGILAVVLGMLLAILVERVVMRSLVRRPPLDGLIATLGVALLLALLELKIFPIDGQPIASPVGDSVFTILGSDLVAARVASLLLAMLVALALFLFLSRTPFGLATRATTSDPTVARLLGVPVNRVYVFAWGVGGALSAAAVALIAPAFGSTIVPFQMTTFGLRALAGAVIGGLDNIWGAILGSVLVGIVQSIAESNTQTSGSADAAILVLVLGTLLVRPRGLLGSSSAA